MEERSHASDGPAGVSQDDAERARQAAEPVEGNLGDALEFRRALGRFATGITIVTAQDPGGQVVGVTANSFCSVSLDPPLVLWCLANAAPSRSVFVDATHFAVHILAEDQPHLSHRFSRPSKNKFAGLDVSEGLGGAPLLGGVVAVFECRAQQHYEAGDHVIILGRVERYRHTDRPPLLFHTGGYRGFGRI